MVISSHFPWSHSDRVFILTNVLPGGFPDFFINLEIVLVGDTHYTVKTCFHCLDLSLRLCGESPELAGIQEKRTSVYKSFRFDMRLMLVFLQMGFSHANAVSVWAASASTSSLMMVPRYLNCFTVSRCCPLTVILVLIASLLFVMSFVFWAPISIPWFVQGHHQLCLFLISFAECVVS